MKRVSCLLLVLTLVALTLGGCVVNVSFGSYPESEKYSVGGATLYDKVRKVSIDYIGDVTVQRATTSMVSFSEKANREMTVDEQLHYYLKGETLYVKYCKSGIKDLANLHKSLEVTLPTTLAKLEISTVSGNVDVEEFSAEFDIETVNGNVTAVCNGDVDVSTVNGNVYLSGKATSCEINSVNGNVMFDFGNNLPCNVDVETVSGNVTLNMPANTGFTAEIEKVFGTVNCEFDVTKNNDVWKCGNGTAKFEIETVYGNINLLKNY